MYLIANKENTITCAVGPSLVLLNRDTGIYYSLNETGAYIWQMLNQPMTISSIISKLLLVFDGQEQHVSSDVHLLVNELTAAGLVHLTSEE